MNGTVGFLIAVGGVSAIIYWLMTRAENRAARRSSDGTGSDYSYDSGSSIGGWSLTNWFPAAIPRPTVRLLRAPPAAGTAEEGEVTAVEVAVMAAAVAVAINVTRGRRNPRFMPVGQGLFRLVPNCFRHQFGIA